MARERSWGTVWGMSAIVIAGSAFYLGIKAFGWYAFACAHVIVGMYVVAILFWGAASEELRRAAAKARLRRTRMKPMLRFHDPEAERSAEELCAALKIKPCQEREELIRSAAAAVGHHMNELIVAGMRSGGAAADVRCCGQQPIRGECDGSKEGFPRQRFDVKG